MNAERRVRVFPVNGLMLLAAVAALAVVSPSEARDYEAGKKKAGEVCKACHGDTGNTPLTPETPLLGGQYYDYLVHSLHAYKSGKRENPLMSPMAQPLTPREIEDLAWYFSKQQGLAQRY